MTDKAIEKLAAKVAKDTLGIPTLKTQNRDSLDFHDVSVVLLKKALIEMYNKGKNESKKNNKG
jgi:hypothetical protein